MLTVTIFALLRSAIARPDRFLGLLLADSQVLLRLSTTANRPDTPLAPDFSRVLRIRLVPSEPAIWASLLPWERDARRRRPELRPQRDLKQEKDKKRERNTPREKTGRETSTSSTIMSRALAVF